MTQFYTYETLEVGAKFDSPTRTIAEGDVLLFAGMTGDMNELHISETFAEKTRFGKRIAHGMLILAMANGLYARVPLFESSVFLGIENLKFLKPVFFGDTIRVQVTILDKRLTKAGNTAIISMQYEVKNQREEVVLEGIFTRMVNA